MAKKVLRKCIGCLELKDRENLIKITKEHSTGEIIINPNTKIFGRSVYLCYNNSCIKDSLKKNKLAKFLKSNLSEDFKEKLQELNKEEIYDKGVKNRKKYEFR